MFATFDRESFYKRESPRPGSRNLRASIARRSLFAIIVASNRPINCLDEGDEQSTLFLALADARFMPTPSIRAKKCLSLERLKHENQATRAAAAMVAV